LGGSDPTISVAISTYNAADYLREAVESVLGQTYAPAEIIVVDDGSTDHTPEVCASFGGAIRYIRQDNDGTMGAGARARAMHEAGGDWIAILDHDDRWLPSKLERQASAIREFPLAGAVLTERRVIDGQGRVVSEPEEVSGGAHQMSSREAFHALLRGTPFSVSSGVVRRGFITEHGLTDPRTVAVADWDLWLNVARRYPVVVVDEVLTEYRVFPEQFVSDKGRLAKLLRATLESHRPNLHRGCAECRESFGEGQKFVAQVFDNAARMDLDAYHAAALGGELSRALPSLWRAVRASPREVARPRRLAAISRNAARAVIKSLRK
jgi:glycosyltransferase involved in cell wall biosynthesis